jgi:transglutaminase-like putative cysteine protease
VNQSEIGRLMFAVACACGVAGLIVGCDLPPRPPLDPTDLRPAKGASSGGPPSGELQVFEAPSILPANWQTWDAYFIGNQHVGYSHVVAEKTGNDDENEILYSMDNRLYFNRGKSRFVQRLVQTSTETSAGNLLRFESSLQVGPAVTRFLGSTDNGILRIETIRGSSHSVRKVPWQSTFRGLVALEQTLRQRPMKNGDEPRALNLLLPGQYELAIARLRCNGRASVPLIDGTPAELLEISCEILIDERSSYSTIWTNDEGLIVRTYSPAFNLFAYRTDEATATLLDDDDLVVAAIDVGGTIDRPSETQRVAYLVTRTRTTTQTDNSLDIEPAPGQYVRVSGDGTYEVLVSRTQENPGKGFVAAELIPTDADSQANHFVDHNARSVQRFATAAVGSRDLTEREAAEELTRTAKRMISVGGESDGFTKASDVVRDGVGNETDHAILLAALLRARRIPSRLAIGIKYAPAERGRMVYHVWTLAYVEGDWLHLDATEGGIAAADRLTLSTTNLSGGNEYDAMLPFLDVIGRMEIKIIAARY